MKKLLAFLLAISLCLTFAACGGDDTPKDSSSKFVKPENYATVLVVTINPQFRLYLDKDGAVLATEPVNDDAKAIISEIKTKDTSLEGVIKEILITANEKGYVKADATVDFKITETVDTAVDTTTLLTKAKDALEKTAKEEKIAVTVEIKTEEKTESDDVVSPTPETESQPEVESSAPAHQHKFSNATCTEPKKCSCGTAEGSALGHSFKNGKCTRCGANDPNFVASFTSVKEKACEWEGMVLSADGNTAYSLGLVLHGAEIVIGAGIGDKIDPDMPEAADAIEINGNLYYFGRGTGGVPLKSVTENGNTVTIIDGADGQLVLTRVDENTLKVTSSPDNFGHEGDDYYVIGKIPVGTTFKPAS